MRDKPYLAAIRGKHPTIKYDASAYTSEGKKTFDGLYTEYIQAVETVDRAIRTIANIGSLAIMKIYRDSKGKPKELPVKNINLDLPNETDSRVDFMRKLFATIFSQGAGLVVTEEAARATGQAYINFYPLDVARIAAESDGTKLISQFVYTSESSEKVIYKAEDCIYINDSIDPSNLLYSLSRLKSLNDVLLLQAGIVSQAKQKISGGAKDSHIIHSEQPISERNMKIIKDAVDTFMQSGTSASLFMNAGIQVTKVGTSMDAKDMLEFFTAINKVILQQFNLPTYLMGDYGANANKSEEIRFALRIFFTTQLKPVFRNIELQFTRFIQERLAIKGAYVKFDFSDMDFLDESIDEKTERALKLNKQGITSMNESRMMVELDPLAAPAADQHYLPAYLTGSAPVSVENFDKEVERLLQIGSTPARPAGNAGGEDNVSVVDNTRGGNDAE